MHVGGQDHFYLETQGCLAIPKGENGEMEIIASTQGLHRTQTLAALALNVPANRIVARVKRIGVCVCVCVCICHCVCVSITSLTNTSLGGGFGGKETRSFYLSTAIAVAAHK